MLRELLVKPYSSLTAGLLLPLAFHSIDPCLTSMATHVVLPTQYPQSCILGRLTL